MSFLNDILQSQGGQVVEQLAGQFGLSSDQATSALSEMVPAIAAGAKNNVSESGIGALAGMLGGSPQDALSKLVGGEGAISQLVELVAGKTGIDASTLTSMLPQVAELVMNTVQKSGGTSGIASLLDQDGDGFDAGDALGLAKKFF